MCATALARFPSRRAGPGLLLATVRRLHARASSAGDPDAVRRRRRPGARRGARARRAIGGSAAVARPIACGPATGAISRSPRSDNASRAASCNSFCPASETKVVYGSNIDNADDRQRQALFRAAERVPLSQRDSSAAAPATARIQVGLAPVKIENDPTLRKGDIVAGENGLMVGRPRSTSAAPSSTSRRRRTACAHVRAPAGAGEGVSRLHSVMACLGISLVTLQARALRCVLEAICRLMRRLSTAAARPRVTVPSMTTVARHLSRADLAEELR